MRADQLTDPLAFHGEGPVWSPAWGGLRFVDMLAGDVLTLAADGAVDRRHVGDVAAVVRPRKGGGAVIAVERGFVLEQADGRLTPLPDVFDDAGLRMNEGGCDPDGRFYCGSMAYDLRHGAGTLYRLDPNGSVHVARTGVSVSNGLEWSPDGSLAYFNDTPTGRIAVFDYDTEQGLTGMRVFAAVDPEAGKPDGLTVDSEGGVWVAMWGGGAVHRYTPDGTLDAVVEVAARNTTACALGGPDLTELYITTSRQGVPAGEDPLAGSLFHVNVGVPGLPVRPFAG